MCDQAAEHLGMVFTNEGIKPYSEKAEGIVKLSASEKRCGFLNIPLIYNSLPQAFLPHSRSGQVWGHTPEQRVAASTLRRYSFGLRLAIAQADARLAMPASIR